MGSIYDEQSLTELEQDERSLTLEELAAILLLLDAFHSDLENELRSFYQRYGKDGVVTYQDARKWASAKDHRRRIAILLLVLSDGFDALHTKIEPKFNSLLSKIVDKEIGFFDVELGSKDVEDILTERWGLDESTWDVRLSDDIDLWKAKVSSDIKQSILRRDHIDDVLERLNKRFVSMERVLTRLAITESTAIGSIARKQIFKELGIQKYRFYAQEDERTCEQCGALHGLVFPITAYEVGVTASPIHGHCRCWEVPITE